ncbi:MAG TPA: methyltransferase [Candidatus Izemoplasmatales bacterium]|nr:methyltransferase [Bacillota bacterium]HRY77509.1 methyltransferase [Candidatus Izemoplasmatales bacterium]
MRHYFTKDNDQLSSNRKTIRFHLRDLLFELETDNGVFSKSGLDFGTRVLLDALRLEPGSTVLDMGCGYGPIGIAAARIFGAKVTMADVNQRAVELARSNAEKYRLDITVVQSDGFANVSGSFSVILMNPPIRAGKQVIYGLFASAKDHLVEGGRLILVIQKKQGAESALGFLRSLYGTAEIIERKSGYQVIACEKH